jgi:Bacterial PH domain
VIASSQARDDAPEHEFEAELGLPEPLPADERLLWQGSPDWRVMAREALHTRMLSVYFGVLLAWRGATVLSNGGSWFDAGLAVLWLLPLAVMAIAVLSLMAWLIARTSVYTITDKRVVMRIGVVLTITFNLPHSQIESAGLRTNADGSGDVTLLLNDADRIAYVHLWPHARPWHLKRSQPMLRALPQARSVATILSAALAESAGVAPTTLRAVVVPPKQAQAPRGEQQLAA